MRKFVILLIVAGFASLAANAQKFDVSIETRYSDFNSLDRRTLVVELLDENEFALAKLNKEISDNPEGVTNYLAFIKNYNENIQKAVAAHWKLNTEIEYKTTKQIKKMIEDRDRKSVILSPVEVGGTDAFITRKEGTAIMLVLYRPEKSTSDPDYKIMMPYAHMRRKTENIASDYMFTLKMAASNIAYMLEKKATSDSYDFMETQAMANCAKLEKKKTLLIEKELVAPSADKDGIRKYYDKSKFKVEKDREEIEKAIEANDAETFYMVLIPYSTFTNPFDRVKKTYMLCYKVIVSAETMEVVNFMEGKAKASPDVALIQEKDFKDLNKCEF